MNNLEESLELEKMGNMREFFEKLTKNLITLMLLSSR